MRSIVQTLPLAFAVATCALLAGVVDYVAGPRMSLLDIVADDFSDLNLTSGLMALWALTVVVTSLRLATRRFPGAGGYLTTTPALFGLGAVANETFGMFEAARMIGVDAGAAQFMLYELRLASALTFLALTLLGLTVQLMIDGRRSGEAR